MAYTDWAAATTKLRQEEAAIAALHDEHEREREAERARERARERHSRRWPASIVQFSSF